MIPRFREKRGIVFLFGGRFFKVIFILFGMGNILVKVHESYRTVVAVCDEDVFGRKLIESKVESPGSKEGAGARRVLDVSGVFFDGQVMNLEEARNVVIRAAKEDATFNFVGKNSVALAKELEIVLDGGVVDIDGVPFALVLM